MHELNLYAELVRGAITNRGTVVPVAECRVNPGERECYRSMFLHGPGLLEWVRQTGSVSGYHAPHTADAFVVDVDDDHDLEHARADALRVVMLLEEIYDVPASYQRIAFSGAKGFHVTVPMAAIADGHLRPNFAQIFHGMAEEAFCGIGTVDLSIYEPRRILRMNNTVNAKTGLHKIPLSFAELHESAESIRELAREPRDRAAVDVMPLSEITRCMGIAALFESHAGRVAQSNGRSHRTRHGEPEEDPQTRALAGLLDGCASGGRNEALVRLTGLFISKGMDETLTLGVMRAWNERNSPPLGEDELTETVAKQFRMYSRDLSPDEAPEIISMREAGETYLRYVRRMQEARVRTGFPALDEKLRAIAPGEVLCIVGRTSVGKSALLQNIARNYASDSGAPVLFFSLEMPETSVYERNVQLEYGMTGYEVERAFGDEDQAREIIDRVGVAMSNFYVVVKPMDVPRIVSYVRYAEANLFGGQKTGLVLVDYLGLVKGRGKSVYEEISRIARDMKDAAKELDVPICYLSQVNKNYKIDQELELGAARDSGSIDEAADYVLGIWRAAPELQAHEREKMRCCVGILKNRKGGLVTLDAWMDKRTLLFTVPEPQRPEAPMPTSEPQAKRRAKTVDIAHTVYDGVEWP